MENKANNKFNTVLGLIVILIGTMFLARNFGLFPGFHLGIIFRWQAILIIIGIITYLNSGNKSVGITIALIGIIGFIPNFWAVILIGIGAYIIYSIKRNSHEQNNFVEFGSINPGNFINETSIFGGSSKKYQIDNFRGGNVTAIFGGSEIDFLDSSLSDEPNVLNLFYIFGGSNIKVPSNWDISIELTPILGELKDKRRIHIEENSNNKKLIIKGFILLGGCDLTN
jgi:predicted membrane protein